MNQFKLALGTWQAFINFYLIWNFFSVCWSTFFLLPASPANYLPNCSDKNKSFHIRDGLVCFCCSRVLCRKTTALLHSKCSWIIRLESGRPWSLPRECVCLCAHWRFMCLLMRWRGTSKFVLVRWHLSGWHESVYVQQTISIENFTWIISISQCCCHMMSTMMFHCYLQGQNLLVDGEERGHGFCPGC